MWTLFLSHTGATEFIQARLVVLGSWGISYCTLHCRKALFAVPKCHCTQTIEWITFYLYFLLNVNKHHDILYLFYLIYVSLHFIISFYNSFSSCLLFCCVFTWLVWFGLVCICSGTHWPGRNRPSITSWPERRDNSTCSCTQPGLPETTT